MVRWTIILMISQVNCKHICESYSKLHQMCSFSNLLYNEPSSLTSDHHQTIAHLPKSTNINPVNEETQTRKKSLVDPESTVPYWISVCLDRSSAESIGVSIRSMVRNAARLAVYDEMIMSVKNHHALPMIRPANDLHQSSITQQNNNIQPDDWHDMRHSLKHKTLVDPNSVKTSDLPLEVLTSKWQYDWV